jgi:hypothetical protein
MEAAADVAASKRWNRITLITLMRVAIVQIRAHSGVINVFGPQNQEKYNPKTVERVAAALARSKGASSV